MKSSCVWYLILYGNRSQAPFPTQFSDNRRKAEYLYLEIDGNTQSSIQKHFFTLSFKQYEELN